MTGEGGPARETAQELVSLRQELERLNGHRYLRVHNSIPKMLAYNFLRGMAVGLGTVMGATVLLSAMVWSLSQIEFLPIIGDWAAQVAEQMRSAQE